MYRQVKLSDVRDMINKGGITCTCWKILDKESDIPYAIVTKPQNGTQKYADNDTYYSCMKIVLYLIIHSDDEKTEYKMDEILNDNDINFTYEMWYSFDDNVCVKEYTFELEED